MPWTELVFNYWQNLNLPIWRIHYAKATLESSLGVKNEFSIKWDWTNVLHRFVWLVSQCLQQQQGFLADWSPDWHLTNLHADTQRQSGNFYFSGSHYIDTDPTSKERAFGTRIKPTTSLPGVTNSTKELPCYNDLEFYLRANL